MSPLFPGLRGWLEARGFCQNSPDEMLGDCPFCGKEAHLSIHVGPKLDRGGRPLAGRGQCFRCKARVWPMRLIEVLDGKSGAEAFAVQEGWRLGGDTGPLAIDRIDVEIDPRPGSVPWGEFEVVAWPDHLRALYGPGLEYTIRRGVNPEVAAAFGLGFIDWGWLHGRVLFPCFDANGDLIYWQARSIIPGCEPKVLSMPRRTSEQAGAGDVVLNLHQAAAVGEGRICLVEGPFDAAVGGLDFASTFGNKLSDRQIHEIAKAGVKAVDIAWDGDPHGWPKAMEVGGPADRLSHLFEVRVVEVPWGSDPADIGSEALSGLRRGAPIWKGGDGVSKLV